MELERRRFLQTLLAVGAEAIVPHPAIDALKKLSKIPDEDPFTLENIQLTNSAASVARFLKQITNPTRVTYQLPENKAQKIANLQHVLIDGNRLLKDLQQTIQQLDLATQLVTRRCGKGMAECLERLNLETIQDFSKDFQQAIIDCARDANLHVGDIVSHKRLKTSFINLPDDIREAVKSALRPPYEEILRRNSGHAEPEQADKDKMVDDVIAAIKECNGRIAIKRGKDASAFSVSLDDTTFETSQEPHELHAKSKYPWQPAPSWTSARNKDHLAAAGRKEPLIGIMDMIRVIPGEFGDSPPEAIIAGRDLLIKVPKNHDLALQLERLSKSQSHANHLS